MKFTRLMGAGILLSLCAAAAAHTHLVKSLPADGATVSAPFPNFVLTFAEPARLTALSIQKDAEPARKISPLPTGAAAEIAVPAPKLAAGRYILSWRAVSNDGHVMPGKVTFTVVQP